MKWFKSKSRESEELTFLRNLSEREKPTISTGSYLGYLLRIRLEYSDVNIKLDYNCIRREWELDVKDSKTGKEIYGYYVTFDVADEATVDFLLNRYNLRGSFEEMEAVINRKNHSDEQGVAALKNKYLK